MDPLSNAVDQLAGAVDHTKDDDTEDDDDDDDDVDYSLPDPLNCTPPASRPTAATPKNRRGSTAASAAKRANASPDWQKSRYRKDEGSAALVVKDQSLRDKFSKHGDAVIDAAISRSTPQTAAKKVQPSMATSMEDEMSAASQPVNMKRRGSTIASASKRNEESNDWKDSRSVLRMCSACVHVHVHIQDRSSSTSLCVTYT